MKFTKLTEAKAHDDYLTFQLEAGGALRQFEISGDVLRQHFGATGTSGAELLQAFETGADAVRKAALEARSIPTDGPIELGSGDFEPQT